MKVNTKLNTVKSKIAVNNHCTCKGNTQEVDSDGKNKRFWPLLSVGDNDLLNHFACVKAHDSNFGFLTYFEASKVKSEHKKVRVNQAATRAFTARSATSSVRYCLTRLRSRI